MFVNTHDLKLLTLIHALTVTSAISLHKEVWTVGLTNVFNLSQWIEQVITNVKLVGTTWNIWGEILELFNISVEYKPRNNKDIKYSNTEQVLIILKTEHNEYSESYVIKINQKHRSG